MNLRIRFVRPNGVLSGGIALLKKKQYQLHVAHKMAVLTVNNASQKNIDRRIETKKP